MFCSKEQRHHLKKKTVKIFGPPGTGKTTTLLNHLDRLFAKGLRPIQVAFLAFTNKAVDTAVERAKKQFLDSTDEDMFNFRTLHSFCRQNFKSKPVIDPETDMVEFAEKLKLPKIRYEKHNGQAVWNDWSLRVYDKARNRLVSPIEQYKKEENKRVVRAKYEIIINAYEQFKKNHRVDFTDMIEEYLEKADDPSFKVLIVDEAQDLTPLQWKLVYKIAKNSDKIYLAGDDDQAIYEWNGAEVENFIDFPGRNFILNRSHRIPKKIHQYSQYISTYIKNRVEKKFIPLKEEGSIFTYNRFIDIPFKQPGSWMILGRTNKIVYELKEEARKLGLYFKDTNDHKSFDSNKYKAVQSWNKLISGDSIQKHEVQVLYMFINDIQHGYRSTDTKKWSSVHKEQLLDLNFLKEYGGLEAEVKNWQDMFNRNFPEKDKIYFENVVKNGTNMDEDPRILIDTIHSIKGDEADHILLYEKSSYAASIYRKNSKAVSSEYRVWYVGVTRAKKNLHILRSNFDTTFPLCRLKNELERLDYE